MGGADGPDMPGVPVWQPRNKEVRRRAAPRSRALPRLTALLAALTSRGARPRQVQWAERYLELCQFRMHHGHCVVPRRFEGACGSLGSWVLSLRVQFKGARMQQRRLDLLRVPPPRPSPRTNRTRRVTHPVLIGHAASLSHPSKDPAEHPASPRPPASPARPVLLAAILPPAAQPRRARAEARDGARAGWQAIGFSWKIRSCRRNVQRGVRPPPPAPPPCTNWTRRVPHPVLSGHVSSFPPY